MSKFIASNVIKGLLKQGLEVQGATVNVLGLTFKENCPDLRNTKVINIIKELKDYGLDVHVNDVEADKEEAQRFYNINLEDKMNYLKLM